MNTAMQQSYRIIIAEDDDVLGTVLTRMVQRAYPTAQVQLYADGLAALHGYGSTGADLIITNHAMPRMDGPTFIRRLRAQDVPVPIFGISGDSGNESTFLHAGANTFLHCPISLATLQQTLYDWLPRPQD